MLDALHTSSQVTAVEPSAVAERAPPDRPQPDRVAAADEPAAVVELSDEARALQARGSAVARGPQAADARPEAASTEPTDVDADTVRRISARDREVRTHEAAHQAAGGGLAGAASFETEQGPDGRSYAVGGHVAIDTSPGKTPEESLQKASTVRSAALAPADPSPADRGVAARANQMAARARQEMAQEQAAEAPTIEEPAEAGEASEEAVEIGAVATDDEPRPAREAALDKPSGKELRAAVAYGKGA